MSAITIKELLPSDSIAALVEKSNFNWDQLLLERAAISGRLVLSAFTRQAIEKFKRK